ncbi:MAG TPA: hypothetical protein DIT75_06280 [Rikenellaceae bacterium]|nr:hypothetical protein [Rikenellaceae bacterium]
MAAAAKTIAFFIIIPIEYFQKFTKLTFSKQLPTSTDNENSIFIKNTSDEKLVMLACLVIIHFNFKPLLPEMIFVSIFVDNRIKIGLW